jgi:hypothetical protein
MIKFNQLRQGDYVKTVYEGTVYEGEVVELKNDQKLACINTGVQEFWFDQQHLEPVALDEAQLMRLSFKKEVLPSGAVKYSKGAFRIQTPSQNNFSDFELWYRDETRHLKTAIAVHELQNHYLDMTKVHLTEESID